MIRSLCGQVSKLSLKAPVSYVPHRPPTTTLTRALFSTDLTATPIFDDDGVQRSVVGEDNRFSVNSHIHQKPRFRNYKKFDGPRKRANKIYNTVLQEHIQKAKEATPQVWEQNFQVGDAIEITCVSEGGANTTEQKNFTKYRGVILGIRRKRMDYSVHIRDHILGEAVEMIIPLHSPLVKSVEILQKNFVFKGRRKTKRAKLYYLREWNPNLTTVTGTKLQKKHAADKREAEKAAAAEAAAEKKSAEA